ncbi:DUF177 domain-containing protein [Thiomonas sp. FB-6]|uniref:YceD family protein n=1 Tax=Thiomonas sp. FB-6 TaxID=1158291 RepID=UPI00036F1244|nr:YceD family protein [Thiomonas sp. FB-6]
MNTPVPPSDAELPRRLNLKDFAQRGRELRGSVAVAALARLGASLHAEAAALAEMRVRWELQGWVRDDASGQAQQLVRLRVEGDLPMLCQRCLQTSWHHVDDTVVLLLVDQEPQLGAEELESDEEAFCARHPVDLVELVEDQLILALPLVPMHESCPQALPVQAGEVQAEKDVPVSPFAVLAGLRKPN